LPPIVQRMVGKLSAIQIVVSSDCFWPNPEVRPLQGSLVTIHATRNAPRQTRHSRTRRAARPSFGTNTPITLVS